MIYPVWKDYDVDITGVTTPLEYSINEADETGAIENTVYKGVAMPKPSTNNVKIRINDFAKNLCNSKINNGLFEEDYTHIEMFNYCKGVNLSYNLNGNRSTTHYFVNNYDYNNNTCIRQTSQIISNPIIPEYSNNGFILFSLFNGSDRMINYEINGNNSDFYIDCDIEPLDGVVLQYKDLPIGKYEIYYEDKTLYKFNVVEKCNRYNLHYINAMGGYDTLPIEGRKDRRTDNFEYSYYKSRGNNQNVLDYQMHKFQTNITPKWELQTGWLSDEQSKKMYNVFGSQSVWLEDIEEGKIYPVYITNNSVEYKTYTNQNKRKYNYSISVTSANTLVKF